VTLKWAAAVSRGISRICRGEPRNLANGTAEFGKICHGKLWSVVISWRVVILVILVILVSFSALTLLVWSYDL